MADVVNDGLVLSAILCEEKVGLDFILFYFI